MLGWAGKAWMELIVGNDIHVKQVRMAGEAWLVAHQTSGAQVPGSNPAFPTMILMRCRIIV